MTEESVEPGEATLVEQKRFFTPGWLLSAALVFLALWGWRELDIRRMRESVETQKAEIRQLIEQNDRMQLRTDRMLASVASPDARAIELSGQQNAVGKVFVDSKSGRAVVVISNLPQNGTTKSYQLWITQGNEAKPQSAAVFDIPPSGDVTLSLDNLPESASLASLGVTLEPKGGAAEPSGPYVLSGKP